MPFLFKEDSIKRGFLIVQLKFSKFNKTICPFLFVSSTRMFCFLLCTLLFLFLHSEVPFTKFHLHLLLCPHNLYTRTEKFTIQLNRYFQRCFILHFVIFKSFRLFLARHVSLVVQCSFDKDIVFIWCLFPIILFTLFSLVLAEIYIEFLSTIGSFPRFLHLFT